MVQIIQENRRPRPPSMADRFKNAFATGIDVGGNTYLREQEKKEALRKINEENEAIKNQFGVDLVGISDPKIRQESLISELSGKQKLQQQRESYLNDLYSKNEGIDQEEQNYGLIKNEFGEKFANIWKSAPTGGRTELLKHALDAKMRGQDINKLLSNIQEPHIAEQQDIPDNLPQVKNGNIPKDLKWPDFSKPPEGYTQKDWINEKKTWRKENAPVFQQNSTRLKNNIKDSLDIKHLGKLNESKKLPEGFERYLINPETGDFYPIAQAAKIASPEAQEWIKITSRFQNRAKDAFGSRVTNFDLQSYMKQFPGLLNTYEGRNRILRMMSINNQLDTIYDKALNQIYKHYGLGNIPQEKADDLAQKMIQDETQRLENEYMHLDELNQMDSFSKEEGLSGNTVDVIGPDGQEYEIDESELALLPKGFRRK